MNNYKEKKVLPISSVCELTDLTERQIRYYEERKLIQPHRTSGGTRKYSFHDVEKLIEISNQVQKGISTYELRQKERKQEMTSPQVRNKMLAGQINAAFKMNNSTYKKQ